ncbi:MULTISPECIES: hypothetical protein [unclassified Janibacter]|uniref:hypothetical protein n=1 Tax=unclassified Janibacter TaxID=2649294 RepID=UPI003CFFF7A1
MILGTGAEPAERTVCSAKGCRAAATSALLWNNPKLHTPERRKVWLACEQHTVSLSDFLDVRGFLRDTCPVGEIPADAG